MDRPMDNLTNELVGGVGSPESGGEGKKESGDGEEQAFRNLCSHYSRGCSLVRLHMENILDTVCSIKTRSRRQYLLKSLQEGEMTPLLLKKNRCNGCQVKTWNSIQAPCCGKVYPCRLCHNEQDFTHEIDRYAVSEVVCRRCSTKQPVSKHCSSCSLNFALYFCPVCRLYDDVDKQQFHCEKCGLCRIGGRENLYHCDKCGLCLPVAIKEDHPCRQGSSKNNCPVCMEDLHSSRDPSHIPNCGHLLHMNCFQGMIKNGLYQCPLCYSSMVDMSKKWEQMDEERDAWQMPFHLRNFQVKIQCRDCHQESTTGFHIIGLKCVHCSSYNTVRCGNEEVPEDAEVALEDVRMQMIWEMIHQMVQARQRERMPALLQRFRERRAAREAEREAERQAAAREALGGGEGEDGEEREGGEGGEGEGRQEGQGGGGENDFHVVPQLDGFDDAVVPQVEIDPPLDFGPQPLAVMDRHSDSEQQSDSEEDSEDSIGGSDSADLRGPPPVLEPDTVSDMSQSDPPESDDGDDSHEDDSHEDDSQDSGSGAELNYWPLIGHLLGHPPLSSDESSESDSDASWVTEEEEVVIGGVTDSSDSEEARDTLPSNTGAPTMSNDSGTQNQHSSSDVAPQDDGEESQEWETASEEMAVDGDM